LILTKSFLDYYQFITNLEFQTEQNNMKKLLTLLLVVSATATFAQRYLSNQFTTVKVTKNVKFGENLGYNTLFTSTEDLLMDVYEPDGDTAKNRPVIILGHAGSFLSLYQWGTKEQNSVVELCNRFAKLGYVAVSISYRIGWAAGDNSKEVREKTIINAVYLSMQDFKTGVRYFKKDASTTNTWKIDPCKIFVGGTNSGGYSSMAVANLNKQSELIGFKFLDSNGNPYINQALTGDFDGFGGSQNLNNHVGYTSNPRAVLALGAATGDSSWVEPGELPTIALAGVDETTTPYNTAVVITGSGAQIIVVSGSGDFMPRVERLGNNAVFNASAAPAGPPNKNSAGVITQSVQGLYPFYGEKFEPWSWYDGAQAVGDPTLNPNATQVKALKYIDTIMAYTAPRFYEIIKDLTPCQVTTSIKEMDRKSDVSFTTVPNPSSNTLTIFSSAVQENITSVTMSDFNGRVVRKIENNESYFAVVNVEDLANGMYAVEIKTKDGVQAIRKVIVQH